MVSYLCSVLNDNYLHYLFHIHFSCVIYLISYWISLFFFIPLVLTNDSMLQHRHSKNIGNNLRSVITHDSDVIYFNAEIASDNSVISTPADYNITRTRNIIDKASDYYLSVVRFTIPSFYVPILLWLPNQYSLTLQWKDNIVQAEIPYIPNNDLDSSDDEYYWVYTIDVVVDGINTAFASAFATLTEDSQSDADWPSGSVAPFMSFTHATNLFAIWTDNFYDIKLQTNPIQIFFNEKLWTLFGQFPYIRTHTGNDFTANGKDVQIKIYDNGVNQRLPDQGTSDTVLIQTQQDFISLYNWNPFKKIVITTNLLPVQSEYTRGSGDSYLKILTDFAPSNDITDQRSVYQYLPTAQYRLIELQSDSPIRQVDYSIWWQDSNYNLYKIEIPWNSEINVKLAFLRKTLYNNNLQDELRKLEFIK